MTEEWEPLLSFACATCAAVFPRESFCFGSAPSSRSISTRLESPSLAALWIGYFVFRNLRLGALTSLKPCCLRKAATVALRLSTRASSSRRAASASSPWRSCSASNASSAWRASSTRRSSSAMSRAASASAAALALASISASQRSFSASCCRWRSASSSCSRRSSSAVSASTGKFTLTVSVAGSFGWQTALQENMLAGGVATRGGRDFEALKT
mmetsp:Transcript_18689/g.56089  ORF Transcript_18689/g.56089 Transcript_18689/m.56089 type:complete len:213 (+) Transcript_18689:470-1108(+)